MSNKKTKLGKIENSVTENTESTSEGEVVCFLENLQIPPYTHY